MWTSITPTRCGAFGWALSVISLCSYLTLINRHKFSLTEAFGNIIVKNHFSIVLNFTLYLWPYLTLMNQSNFQSSKRAAGPEFARCKYDKFEAEWFLILNKKIFLQEAYRPRYTDYSLVLSGGCPLSCPRVTPHPDMTMTGQRYPLPRQDHARIEGAYLQTDKQTESITFPSHCVRVW